MISLSVIIPVFNEMGIGYLEKNLTLLEKFENIEVICIDSMSVDGSFEMISSFSFVKCLRSDSNLRAERLNIGIRESIGEMILLCHPRSLLQQEGIQYLIDRSAQLAWGGFTHKFDQDSFGLKFTSWYSNTIRAGIFSNLYLDHCIFIRKNLIEHFGKESLLKNVAIFEDTHLSYKLRAYGPAQILSFEVITSAIRFKENGFFFQSLANQILKILLFLGFSDEKMNRFYERGLSLNSKY